MPFSKPQYLIPILHPEVSLEALEQLLSMEQIQIIMRLDGVTSVRGLAHLLNRSLTDITAEVQELVVQGVLQLFKRISKEGRLEPVPWPPPTAGDEWLALPGIQDDSSVSADTEPEVYTISSMELIAFQEDLSNKNHTTPSTPPPKHRDPDKQQLPVIVRRTQKQFQPPLQSQPPLQPPPPLQSASGVSYTPIPHQPSGSDATKAAFLGRSGMMPPPPKVLHFNSGQHSEFPQELELEQEEPGLWDDLEKAPEEEEDIFQDSTVVSSFSYLEMLAAEELSETLEKAPPPPASKEAEKP